jgi:exopolysaccharide biosynthesis polyprenyl glycosylphosphotransferase
MRAHRDLVRGGATKVSWLFDDLFALALMVAIFVVTNSVRLDIGIDEFVVLRLSVRNVMLAGLFIVVWHAWFAVFGLYTLRTAGSIANTSARVVAACTGASVVLTLFIPASRSGAFGLRVVFYFWLVSTVVALIGRTSIMLLARYAEHRSLEPLQVVIVGSGSLALRLYQRVTSRDGARYVVAGFIDSRDPGVMPEEIRKRLIGTLADFERLVSNQPIDLVLIALPVKSHYEAIQGVIEACESIGVEAKYLSDVFAVSRARHAFDEDDGFSGVRLQLVADDHRLIIKRAIDLAGAIVGLIVFLPLMLVCAIAIKMTSPGPVLFCQLRYGRNRRLFYMYKFRTMTKDAERLQSSLEGQNEASGPVFKIQGDPRITPVGRWLRRLSLDELPQLLNVLQGHMSLVGPRPLPIRDVSQFNETWLLRRFSVKPGLTCLWQVSGRSNVAFDHWVRLDLDYIDNWSLLLDMQILIKTVPAVLSGSGAM